MPSIVLKHLRAAREEIRSTRTQSALDRHLRKAAKHATNAGVKIVDAAQVVAEQTPVVVQSVNDSASSLRDRMRQRRLDRARRLIEKLDT